MTFVSAVRRHGMTTTDPTFTGISSVAIPVTDQDRSKALLARLGFQTRFDAELQDGFRWVELAPPGAATAVSLVTTGQELPTGVDTGIRLITPDARLAREELLTLGLAVGELLDWESVPLMFSFEDYDGNRLYVAEPSER
jgi:catechol 2,3-dioxygenase-like lactoylglutathione lyase family enzyme